MANLWIEKYRPARVSEVVHQDFIKQLLTNCLAKNLEELPHLLFYGPAGTGKTSTILALAREIYGGMEGGLSNFVLELNASDDRGIDVIRTRVKQFSKILVTTRSARSAIGGGGGGGGMFKLVILDECDSMTTDAQNSLRRIIEDTSQHTRFALICNYVSRIIDPLLSRCLVYRFNPLPFSAQTRKLTQIAQKESEGKKSELTEECIAEIAAISKGDLRAAINLLQTVLDVGSHTPEDIREIAGQPPTPLIDTILAPLDSKNPPPKNPDNSKVNNKSNTDKPKAAHKIVLETYREIVRQGCNSRLVLEAVAMRIAHHPSLPDNRKSKLFNLLGLCDARIARGADENLQLLQIINDLNQI